VGIQAGTTLVAGRPHVLFRFPMAAFPGSRPFDLGPDGRFLIVRNGDPEAAGGRSSNLIFVEHWFEELKRLVPTN
jgi:hypothetical protein